MVHYGVIVGLCLGIPALFAVAVALVVAFKKQIADWFDFKVLYAKQNTETIGFLRGNFAPTPKEETIADLPVKGEIPKGLSGLFLRNGPNPYFQPLGRTLLPRLRLHLPFSQKTLSPRPPGATLLPTAWR